MRNSECSYCRLGATCSTVCVWGISGVKNAKIMLLSDMPTEEQNRGNSFLTSGIGLEVEAALESCGVRVEDVYITSVVKCRTPQARTPSKEETASCLGYLLEEIAEVNPKVIVAMGSYALEALTGKGTNLSRERGKLLKAKPSFRIDPDISIIATFNPSSYVFRGGDATIFSYICDDLALAKRIAYPPVKSEREPVLLIEADKDIAFFDEQHTEGYTVQDLKNALADLDGAKALACDLEWTGGETMHWPWRRGSVAYSIALTGRVDGELRSLALSWPPPNGGKEVLQAFFDKHPLIFHNAQADLIWLRYLGFSIKLGGDTMLLAQLIDEGRSLSLESLATTVGGSEIGWKIPPRPLRPKLRSEWEELLTYNASDTKATLLLAEALHRQVKSLPYEERINIERFYTQLSLPSISTFISMAFSGVGVDVPLLEQTIEESKEVTKKHAEKLAELINKHTGYSDWDIQASEVTADEAASIATSPQKSVQVLRENFRLDITSSAKDVLVHHQDVPAVAEIIGIRHEKKARGTYLNPWLQLTQECVDSRLHTLYRMAGARTGRTSAELEMGGSIQVAPREKRFRRIIKAKDGNVIVAADQSQVELRVAAWIANEPTMISLYQNGADLHLRTAIETDRKTAMETAKAITGEITSYEQAVKVLLETDDLLKKFSQWIELRQRAKGVNFGFVYGMQEDSFIDYAFLSYNAVFTLEEATRVRDAYFNAYPKLLEWHARAEYNWRRLGYVVSPLGRYRRHIEKVTEAINTPVQSTASDITALAMTEALREVRARKLPAELIGFVHDSIMFECPDSFKEEVSEILVNAMENPPLYRFGIESIPVPLKADVKVSERWAA